jgi:hypothetical protein
MHHSWQKDYHFDERNHNQMIMATKYLTTNGPFAVILIVS